MLVLSEEICTQRCRGKGERRGEEGGREESKESEIDRDRQRQSPNKKNQRETLRGAGCQAGICFVKLSVHIGGITIRGGDA